jgi:class 3 adenylate cyclase
MRVVLLRSDTVTNTTNCERCGQVNAAGQRFCGGCGAPLAKTCPACGHANSAEFRFCGSCGEALGDSAATQDTARVEERRWATVLFADLSGFTSRSETLDPEEVSGLVDRCMRRLGETIERYGGVIANVAGDGLLAIFGVPKAHEDDAERAVRAGLELQRCTREYESDFGGLELRVGVNSGEMMFASIGHESYREPTVYGDSVNTASRLESAAPVGGVLVGAETYQATCDAFAYEAVPPLRIKGKATPVAAWIAEKALGAPAKRAVSSVLMVGRDLELDFLTRMWQRALTEQRPRLATIVGPAGIGKPRLVEEFLRRIPLTDGTRAIYSGRCLPYGKGITYWPLREILWAAAGIALDDSAAVAAEQLQQLLVALSTSAEMRPSDAERTTFALATSCGVPLAHNPLEHVSPESVAEEVGLAWPRFLSALAAREPTTVVIEDLHWAEPPLFEMIERMLARSSGRLLIVATARPEFADVRPGWSSKPGMAQISLEPFTDAESRELLCALLPDARPEVYEKVVAAAEGNPFFTEEIVRHLTAVEEPASTVAIPSTVWALLAARIDALADEEKSLLQDAAVVGRAFWPTPLEGMRPGRRAHDTLRSLEEQGLIMTRPTSSLPGEAELWFRHALMQDVAYRSIPKRGRAAAHVAVARWIEQLAGDRREEFIDLLAHHYESAATPEVAAVAWPDGSPEREAARAKAVEALLRAGAAAARRYAIEQALDFADRVLALAHSDGERLPALELRARALHGAVRADDALASYLEALEMARGLDDRGAICRLRAYAALLCARYSGALTGEAWKTAAAQIVTEGLAELGEEAETFEAGALLVGRSRMPRWLATAPDRKQTRGDAERAIEIAEAIDSAYLLSYAVEALSQPTVQDGFCEAESIAERMLMVADALADRVEAHETRVLAALLFSRANRLEAAQQAADDAARQAAELSPHRRLHAAGAQTMSLFGDGHLTRLRSATADVPELIHEDGGRVCPYGAMALAGHAVTLFEAGDPNGAAAAVELLDRASQGSEGPALLFRAAEIIRPLTSLEDALSRIERIVGSADTVPRIYQLRTALQVHALSGDEVLELLVAEARALAGPACAPSLASVAGWAEAVVLARSGSSRESLATAGEAMRELEAYGESYTAARLMTDLLPMLDRHFAAGAAAKTAERLEAMGAHASAAQAQRHAAGLYSAREAVLARHEGGGAQTSTALRRTVAQATTPASGTSPGTGGPFGAATIARSSNPTAFSHQLVPDLGTLWAETEVSAPVAGIPSLHLAGHIDNVLSIAVRKPLTELAKVTEDVDLRAGQILCREGERGQEFFVIMRARSG